MKEYLKRFGLIGDTSVVFHPRTRDSADLEVQRCTATGVIFLEPGQKSSESHYEDKQAENDGLTVMTRLGDAVVTNASLADSARRLDQFRNVIAGKLVCDFGTGHGMFLRGAKAIAREVVGVELNRAQVAELRQDGFRVEQSISSLPSRLEVVTLFHVLEHLRAPIEVLSELRGKMAPGAHLIVEVPHSRDFLFETLGSQAFKNFTFWSEHLVLHTRQSLERTLSLAGFQATSVIGHQRHGLENHLHWLARDRPGGHEEWAHLSNRDLNVAYGHLLQSLDQTDTLIGVARA